MTYSMVQDHVPALFVVPVPTESTPDAARPGVVLRAQAMVRGRCACGALLENAELGHENDCPAISRAVENAILSGLVRWASVRAMVPLERFNVAPASL